VSRENPNTVQIVASNGTVVYETEYRGPSVDGDSRPADHPEVTEPYITYSPNASVQVLITIIISLMSYRAILHQ